MLARREPGLSAGEVESHDRVVTAAAAHTQLGDLDGSRPGAHRADDRAHDDRLTDSGRVVLTITEARLHCVHDLVERQPVLLVQLRGEPHLGVHDAVGGEVERGLTRDAVQRGRRLHHRERVLERRQVLEDVAGAGPTREPRRELVRIGRGEVRVSDRVGELDDRRGPQPAVEVIVEQDLRRRPHRLERHGSRHQHSLLTRMRSDVLE